jgi:xyloglucan-specific exo-beta-1,4-glucanase
VKVFIRFSWIRRYLIIAIIALNNISLEAQTFGNLPMGGTGFVSGIIPCRTEPGLCYVRTDIGGAYRRDSVNGKWIPLLDWVTNADIGYLGVESIALDPQDPDRVYMAVGLSYFNNGKSAIFRSSDRGRTFQITEVTSKFKFHGNGMGRNNGEKLAVDPNLGSLLYCGTRADGLFKSQDYGASWTRVTSLNVTTTSTENGISFVLFDPTSGTPGNATQTMFVGLSGTGTNFYRSDDGGARFTAISDSPKSLMPSRAALASDSTIYITYADAPGPWDPKSGQVWNYNISTGVWKNITPSGFSTPFGGISVDPLNPQRVVLSTINTYQRQGNGWGDQIFISNNGGKTWTNKIAAGFSVDPNGVEWAKSGGVTIHWAGSIEFDPFNTSRVSVVSGNGVFTTDNIEASTVVWKFDVKGIEESAILDFISIPGGPAISAIGDYDGFLHRSTDEYPKRLAPSMGTTGGVAYAAMNPAIVARTGSKFYISSDTAKSWTLVTSKGEQGSISISANGKVILHTTGSGQTFRTPDNGKTWTVVAGLSFSNVRTFADGANPEVFYAMNSGASRILVSIDGGKTFNASGSLGISASRVIRPVPGFDGHIWLAAYSGGLQRSFDYGASFVKVKGVTSCTSVGVGKALPGMDYPVVYIWGIIAGKEGLYYSVDQGISWNRMIWPDYEWGGAGNGKFLIGDMNTPGLVYLGSEGRGVMYARAAQMPSAASVNIPMGDSALVSVVTLTGDEKAWKWTSADPSKAAADSTGMVIGIAEGTVELTATDTSGSTLKIGVNITSLVTDISFTPLTDTLFVGETLQLSATVVPETASNKKLNWSSTDPAVVSVSSAGLLTAVKKGRTIISASSVNGIRYSMPLVVILPVKSLSLNKSSDTIEISGSIQLTAKVLPADASDPSVLWSSSDDGVAIVGETGLVTGISEGSSVITASSADGKVKAECEITVVTDINAGESNISAGKEINVFPNPLKQGILCINPGKESIKNLQITDLRGAVLREMKIQGGGIIQVNTGLSSGIYLLKFYGEKNVIVRKLTVE